MQPEILMPKSIATDLMHTNSEYEKLKKGGTDRNRTPRENPSSQGAGRRGYDKALYADWTINELRQQAERLEIAGYKELDRDRLITVLERHDTTLARAGR